MRRTAIEVGTDMISVQVQPMDRGQTETLLRFSMMAADPEHAEQVLAGMRDQWPTLGEILARRVEAADVPCEARAVLMLARMSESPGDAVMYAAALAAIYAKVGHKVTLTDVVEAFPWGFPTEAGRQRIWQSQKLSREERGDAIMDNSLDTAAAWGLDPPPPTTG